VHKEAGYHHTCTTLTGLAVNCDDVVGSTGEETLDGGTETTDHVKGGGVVVVKGIPRERKEKRKERKKGKRSEATSKEGQHIVYRSMR